MRVGLQAALSAPIVGMVGRRRRDQGLDRQVAAVLELQRMLRYPELHSMDPVTARDYAENGLSPLDMPSVPMAELVDITVEGPGGPVPVRLYVPERAGPHWLVYMHGGGGVIGSIRASDPVARVLAAQTSCTVASVGYRLGPEDPHPAAIDDACAVWDAIVRRVPRGGKIAVGGDSFGGFLTAHVERHARTGGNRRADLQVQIYPMVDLAMTSPSIDEHAEGYLLTRAMMRWFHGHYVGGADPKAGSPHYWADAALRGASPAIVVTAGFDPLVDEGDAHARRLRDAGVLVRHRRHASLIHGFLSLAGVVREARRAVDEMCGDIVELLASA